MKQSLSIKMVRFCQFTKKKIATVNSFQQLKSPNNEPLMHTAEIDRRTKEAQFCFSAKKETRYRITRLIYSTKILKERTYIPHVIWLWISSLPSRSRMFITNCSMSLSETAYFLNCEQMRVKITMFLKRDQFKNSYHEKFQNMLDSTKQFY